jgi:Zn-dependent M28 family amino/carboxypeptidase
MGPRSPGSAGHVRARAWLLDSLRKVARDVTVDDFDGTLDGRKVALTNVQADLGPAGERPILLAAHWDTRPWADQDRDPRLRNRSLIGANDGASGVAVLLEVARVLRPRVPVRLVVFDGEDLGRDLSGFFQGSRRYAEGLVPGAVRWGLLLDMVGDRDLEIPREQLSREAAPEVLAKVWAAARRLGYARHFPDRDGPRIYDDHWPLIQAGVRMADLIDFDYAYWHTTGDTAERCSPASLEVVGRTVVRAVEAETP